MLDYLGGLVDRHGYGAVGAIIFFESMGIPLPGESLLIGAALYAAHAGGLRIEGIIAVAALGAIMGDNAGYMVGHYGGTRLLARYGPRIGLTPERQHLGKFLFRRHGPKVVFFGRFTAFLRTFAAVLAGAYDMPWGRFLFWNALGGISWTMLYGLGAYLVGSQIKHLVGPIGLGIGVVAVIVVVWSWRFVRQNETRLIEEAKAEAG